MSLRSRSEWTSLAVTVAVAPMIAVVVGRVWHEVIGVSSAAVLVVVGMIYITIARGALLGSCVMIGKTQFCDLFAIVDRCASLLDVPVPMVFLREDVLVPVVALGFGEPYSLVISTHWLEHFEPDELTFMIGRELGHIKAGHTRLTSILSVNGRVNPFISFLFGAWLRRTEYTADRVGLLCCGSTDAAYRAIALCEFHAFARKVDLEAFAQQLINAGLAQNESPRAGKQLYEQRSKRKRSEWMQTLTNILYIKLPIFDPDRLLKRMLRWVGWIFSLSFFTLSVVLMLSAAMLVATHFETFHSKLPDQNLFFRFQTVMWLWAALGVVKVIHEFGHGLSCKVFGGEVHEMGALLLCL